MHNQKEVVSVHYIKDYVKEELKTILSDVEPYDVNLFCQLRPKPLIHQRLLSKIHPRYFTFSCCLISMPLCKILKEYAFRSLRLAQNNIDLVLSYPKCIINLLSTKLSHKLKKSLINCFSISISLLCWKTIQVPSA